MAFLLPTNDSFVALTQCDKQILKQWEKSQKVDMARLKINVLRKFYFFTLIAKLKRVAFLFTRPSNFFYACIFYLKKNWIQKEILI